MTALVHSAFARPFPRLQVLRRSIGAFFAGVREGMAMADHYKVLASLTDAELAQRGLTRADIPRVVAQRLFRA
jgi:uncharacterized protein YjiS (DUF1127 family)